MGDVLKFRPAGSTTSLVSGTNQDDERTKSAPASCIVPSSKTDLDDVRMGLKILAELVQERGGTGLAVVMTKAGKPDSEYVFGELARDKDLAYAAARRLVDRTGWPS